MLSVVSARPGKEALIGVHVEVGVRIGCPCVGSDVAFPDCLVIVTTRVDAVCVTGLMPLFADPEHELTRSMTNITA
jgi:hypothetical protein